VKIVLNDYQNFIFDCDGVLLDSNNIKGDIFVKIAEHFSLEHAQEFKAFHDKNGGLNRRDKFTYFFEKILKRTNFEKDLAEALNLFRTKSLEALKSAQLVPGVEDFLKNLPENSKKYVISAGDQDDLILVLGAKKLSGYFDKLFGGPKLKTDIISELKLTGKTIFFGDSEIDYKSANKFNFDFVFVYGVCSWPDWKNVKLKTIKDFTEISLS